MNFRYKVLLYIFLFLTAAIISSYWYINKISNIVIVEKDSLFLLKRTDSQKEIIKQLNFKKIKIQYYKWRLASLFNNKNFIPKAGEYFIPKGSSIKDIQQLFQSGNTYTRYFTLIDGWTVIDLRKALINASGLSGEISLLKEGIYKPDTYNYKWGYSRQNLLTRMKLVQDELLSKVWKNRPKDFILKNKNEILILASIIQQESSNVNDSQLIASVFINRLKKKMRLQSDVTLAYGMKINGTKITKKMLKSNNPFNTYLIKGLPPTPISYPGKSAINALNDIKKSEYLYFVSNGIGGHRFSSTYELHKKNVKLWKEFKIKDSTIEKK